MQFNSIRSFHWAAHYESILLAAEHLCVAPSAISSQISQLEKRYGLKLFQRTSNSIQLTPLGMSLKKETDKLFQAVDRVDQLLIKTKDRRSKTFNLGSENLGYVLDLLKNDTLFLNDYIIRFFDSQHSSLIKMINQNKLDILIAYSTSLDGIESPEDNLNRFWLSRSHLCLIASSELKGLPSKISNRTDLINVLTTHPMIGRTKGSFTRYLQEEIYKRLQIEKNYYSEVSNRESFHKLIQKNLGLGFLICDKRSQLDGIQKIDFPDDDEILDLLSIDQYMYYMSDLEEHRIIKFLKSQRTDRHHPAQAYG